MRRGSLLLNDQRVKMVLDSVLCTFEVGGILRPLLAAFIDSSQQINIVLDSPLPSA